MPRQPAGSGSRNPKISLSQTLTGQRSARHGNPYSAARGSITGTAGGVCRVQSDSIYFGPLNPVCNLSEINNFESAALMPAKTDEMLTRFLKNARTFSIKTA